MNETSVVKARFSTREIADSLGEQVGNVRSVAFRLFPRGEIEIADNEFVFTIEQTEKIEAVFKKESQPKSLVIAPTKIQDSVIQEWYTIEELAELCGISVETLKGGHSPLISKDFGIGIKTESKIRNLGGHRNVKVYSENVLKALRMYQIKNGTSNAMKNKAKVQENIVRNVSELTYKSTVEQIKQQFNEGYEMLSDATKEMMARDFKIGMQEKFIAEAEPKAEYYDKVCSADNLTEIGSVGKAVKIGAQKFFDVLKDDKIIRKRFVDGVGFYEPYYGYEKYFGSIPVPFNKDGKDLVRNKLMFNADGVVWATRRYSK